MAAVADDLPRVVAAEIGDDDIAVEGPAFEIECGAFAEGIPDAAVGWQAEAVAASMKNEPPATARLKPLDPNYIWK